MKRARALCVASCILSIVYSALAKDRPLAVSPYRRYFWGARASYEKRDFQHAAKQLKTFKALGQPADPLLKQVGCDIPQAVKQFSAALKGARSCMAGRGHSAHWGFNESEHAKLAILNALHSGDTSALEPYVDCAPTDLTAQPNVCQVPTYPAPADLSRLASALKEIPEVLEHPNWREFPLEVTLSKNRTPERWASGPLKAKDPLRIRWVLHTYSDHWHPCGMEAAPLVSLRQDENGDLRIAGFAASCLKTTP